jgi:putative oxidoreductase
MHALDLAALLIRLSLGMTMLAHVWNHAFGGGKIAGTSRWFESIGMKPATLHAYLATVTEIGAGTLLLVGLLIPIACAGIVGCMGVALVANHIRNGFFIFLPGEGFEYVLLIIVVAVSLAALGAGHGSIDAAPGIRPDLDEWVGLGVGAGGGAFSATATSLVAWRPPSRHQGPSR